MKKDLKSRDIFKSIDYTPLLFKIEEIYPQEKKSIVMQCDEERIIFDLSHRNYIYMILGTMCFIILFLSFISENRYEFTEFDGVTMRIAQFWLLITLLLGSFISLFVALYGCFGTLNKRYIFDRKNGTVTYPAFGWFNSITQPFDQTIFILAQVGPFGGKGADFLAILRPDGWTRTVINSKQVHKFFSLYVWYMDRNRPLPPGTAFDPYREKDYERRKKEGFPAPLYPSNLNIIEHEGGKVEIMPELVTPLTPGELYVLELDRERRRQKIKEAKKHQ